MILTGLIPLYKSAITHNFTYALFEFKKNNIVFHIFFDFATLPYQIGFIVQNSDFSFWIEANKWFVIKPFIAHDKFKELMKLLNLKPDVNNKFKATLFFQEFNASIPSTFALPNKKVLIHIARTRYKIEEGKNIYYLCLKPWSNRMRSNENTEKNRLLYPELHKQLEHRKNISVCYTDKQIKNENITIENDLRRNQ